MTSQRNYNRILEAIETIKKQDVDFTKQGVWVCIGSAVTNTSTISSDIDLLLFSRATLGFKKFQSKNFIISCCLVPEHMLVEDSLTGKYGGYFAAKLFNPHIIMANQDNLLTERIIQAPAIHFLPFINYLLKNHVVRSKEMIDYDMLTAIALSAYFDSNPYFEGWWIKLWGLKNYPSIWSNVVEQFAGSLRSVGATQNYAEIEIRKFLNVKTPRILSQQEYDFAAFERGINHWGFGIVAHKNEFSYLDWAYSKAKYNITRRGGYTGDMYQAMIKDIYNRAGLASHYRSKQSENQTI